MDESRKTKLVLCADFNLTKYSRTSLSGHPLYIHLLITDTFSGNGLTKKPHGKPLLSGHLLIAADTFWVPMVSAIEKFYSRLNFMENYIYYYYVIRIRQPFKCYIFSKLIFLYHWIYIFKNQKERQHNVSFVYFYKIITFV